MHVVRARAVCALRNQRTSLKSIRAQLSTLSEAELAALHPTPDPTLNLVLAAPQLQPPLPQFTPPPFQSWDVATLMPGLVLLVRANGDAVVKGVAEAIYRAYARGE